MKETCPAQGLDDYEVAYYEAQLQAQRTPGGRVTERFSELEITRTLTWLTHRAWPESYDRYIHDGGTD
jgi:hypothetical protein